MGFSWRGGVSRGVHGVIWGWQPEELLSLPGVPISIPGRTWVNPSSSSSIPTAPLPSGKPQTVLDLHGISKALSMRMLDLNSKTVIFESQPTPSHLCPTSNGILERPQIADGNCVAGRLCFNSTSIRWDMKKKGIFRRLFWLLSFWEEVNTSLGIVECPGSSLGGSLLGQPGLIGCQQTSHSLPGTCGSVPGASFPLGFAAANELRDSQVSPGLGLLCLCTLLCPLGGV